MAKDTTKPPRNKPDESIDWVQQFLAKLLSWFGGKK